MIAIGCDHGGFELKNHIVKYLTDKGYDVKDYGVFCEDSVDYPDCAEPVCNAVTRKSEYLYAERESGFRLPQTSIRGFVRRFALMCTARKCQDAITTQIFSVWEDVYSDVSLRL